MSPIGKIVKYNLAAIMIATSAVTVDSVYRDSKMSRTNNIIYESLNTDVFEKKEDKDKIIEFNKAQKVFYKNIGNYAIVDKKNCKLMVYNSDGESIKEYYVGVGACIGDNLGYGSALGKTDSSYKLGRYTTAGEFVLDKVPIKRRSKKSQELYGERIIYLKGDNKGKNSTQEAIHQTSGDYGKKRLENDKDGVITDNRFSSGCIVMLPDQYDDLMNYLSEGDRVYVLPEENGNKLILKKNGRTLQFVQQNHSDQERDISADKASKVIYDYYPNKALSRKDKYIGYFYKILNKLRI